MKNAITKVKNSIDQINKQLHRLEEIMSSRIKFRDIMKCRIKSNMLRFNEVLFMIQKGRREKIRKAEYSKVE